MTKDTTQVPAGLPPVSVRIRSLGREVGAGVTTPYFCTLSGILKFDYPDEAPNCVYNELVAMRLGCCVGAPVASGALVSAERGEGFVSLMIGARNFKLPDLDVEFRTDAVRAFPNHAASLLAFDIFIGNMDRGSNLKADIKRKNLQFFSGFDHSHCLLDTTLDLDQSIELLGSDALILQEHPFFKVVGLSPGRVDYYVEKIANLSDDSILSACVFGEVFRRVTMDQQERLAEALCRRKDLLPEIVRNHRDIIFCP